MNTEAWDEFSKLEEEADSILVGPSTAGRVGKYVSTRQRLKAPAAEVPAKAEAPAKKNKVVYKRLAELIVANASSLPVGLTVVGRRQQLKRGEISANTQALLDALAQATAVDVSTVGTSQFVVTTEQPISKTTKRKLTKRKSS